jgi:hypothetical protein
MEPKRILFYKGRTTYLSMRSKLEDRRKSRKLNLFDKIENNMAPTYLSDCLPTTIGETVTYNLRNNDDYRTQYVLA